MPADAPISSISEYGRQKAEAEHMLRVRMAGGAPIGVVCTENLNPDVVMVKPAEDRV